MAAGLMHWLFWLPQLSAHWQFLGLDACCLEIHPRVLYGPYATIVLPTSPRALQLLTAAASAVSAVAYAALLHWFAPAVNRALIVVQFVLFTIGTAVIALAMVSLNSALMAIKQENVTVFVIWHLRILWLGALSLGLGCLAFVMNVGRALIKAFQRSSN